ncbi:hypothetical protein NA56DRAFT_686658 [Hyaloscypha hepaticicola]|uniref:Phosphoglycerate mutase family protein n=1 Tax=Hyaloscypha hepaticicola TaxID=2082293 RepID=A0A2J6QEB9_9HELO|nr:hypothetical protein NA56DRAFT_686658 [Hyaloscypha hepaticicola]
MTHPIIYLIRHGEKPPKVDGKDQDGLSAQGEERAQGLQVTFGKFSPYNIQYIIAEHPKKSGSRDRPYDTVLPLAEELSLKINKSIDRDDAQGAADAAKAYDGDGNVLVCWEHGVLSKIVAALGVTEPVVYPEERFDIIWMVKHPYETLEWVGSEDVQGIDGPQNPAETGPLPVDTTAA